MCLDRLSLAQLYERACGVLPLASVSREIQDALCKDDPQAALIRLKKLLAILLSGAL